MKKLEENDLIVLGELMEYEIMEERSFAKIVLIDDGGIYFDELLCVRDGAKVDSVKMTRFAKLQDYHLVFENYGNVNCKLEDFENKFPEYFIWVK